MNRKPPVPSGWLVVLVAAVLFGAYCVHEVLVPFGLSLGIAYLLNPAVKYFEVRGFRRDHLVLALYMVIALGLTIVANTLLPAISHELALLQAKAPVYFAQIQAILAEQQARFAERMPFGSAAIQAWNLKLYEPIMQQLPKIPSYVLSLFPLFSLLFLVPFITFFLLLDSHKILENAVQICPSRHVEKVLHLFTEIDTSMGNYIRGLMTIVLAIGTMSYVGLCVLGVDYALAIATLAGVASLVPYFGAALGAGVGMLVAFFQYHSAAAAMEVLLLFALIRLADEAFIIPFVSKHSVRLHPLVFLLALMIGAKAFGFVGLLFAVPAACIVKSLIVVAWEWYMTEAQMTGSRIDGSHVPYV